MNVVLIGCTKVKRTEPSAARDLYDPSDLFRKRRAWAEATGCPWGVASALHGFLAPDELVAPYDYTMADVKRRWSTFQWAVGVLQGVAQHAGVKLASGLVVEVHAGREYVDPLRAAAERMRQTGAEVTITVPMAGLGIGYQKAAYLAAALPVELAL